ncbi:MAG: aspartate aminotransferase family protein [Hyphomicrobiales bacterium]
MSEANRSRVFYRHLKSEYPSARTGAGAYITDAAGKQYLDASGGAAISCLGHGHPRIIAAIKNQLDNMAFAHTRFFTSSAAEELAATLSEKAPGGAWRTYFLSGGSEVNEAAMKLTRQLQVERGWKSRDTFIARQQSYHGNTIGALSLSGNPHRREVFEPVLMHHVRHVAPCYSYRLKEKGESDDAYGRRASAALGGEIASLGEGRAIAFFAETVVGSTLGAVPPAPGYFKEIQRICDETGTLLVLDEVMAGMGRTGTLFSCEQDGIVPDMISIAKGLGAGYQSIGALMVRDELADEIESGSGFFQHGHSYVGHPTACAAALEVQRVFEDEGLIERCAKMGAKLRSALSEAFAGHPHVGDIRGRGLMLGIEFVADRQTKEPFDASRNVAAKLKARAMDNGLVCYPDNGTVDGERGDHVLIAPPFIITDAQISELVEKLGKSIDEAIG